MEFFSALKEQTVIISLSFSLILYLFPDQGKRVGKWIISTIQIFASGLSLTIKQRIKVRRYRKNKAIVKKINSPYQMQWEITRSYSFMLLFSIFISSYILLIAMGPLKGIGNLPVTLQYIIYSPVLILELLWLIQRDRAKSLIKIAEKRITSH
jgi:hypothetical protein